MEVTNKIQEFLAFTGLNGSITTVLTAIIILFVGWIIAKAISKLVGKALNKTKMDDKLMAGSGVNPSSFISSLVYYLLMLMVLLVVLETMGISQVLDPLKDMLGKIFDFIPNLFTAGIIGFIGYIIATFVSNLVSMGGTLADNLAQKSGFNDTGKLINALKKLVFIVILIPFVIQALNTLNLEAISGPANEILSKIFNIIPNLLGAGVIIALFVVGGRFLTGFLEDLLRSFGTDSLPNRLQLSSVVGQGQSLSKIVASIAFGFLVFFGVITGVDMLGLDQLSNILNTILSTVGQIMFGLIFLVIGNFIATLVYNALSKSDSNKFIANIVRFAILGLFLAISLSTMGIADGIVELAFGLTLGAIAVAFALAYGLGGREAAGEHAKEILGKLKK